MERLEQQFIEQGYRQIRTSAAEVQGFLRERNEFSICVCMIDNRNQFLDAYGKQDYLIERMGQLIHQRTQKEVRCLGVVLTNRASETRRMTSGRSPFWFLDSASGKLIIYEDQPSTFYGVERLLETVYEQGTKESDIVYTGEVVDSNETGWKSPYGKTRYAGQSPVRKSVRAFELTPVNTALVILNIVVFLVLELFGSTENASFLYQFGGMTIESVLVDQQYWRLLTCAFLHFGLSHIFNNMVVLAFSGDNLERALGSGKYLLFYLLSAVGSSFVSCLWMFLTGQHYVVSVGASGAIFAVLGGIFYVLLRNHGRSEDLNVWKVGLFLGFSIFQGFTSVTTNNSAHISGLIIGFLLAMMLYRKKN